MIFGYVNPFASINDLDEHMLSLTEFGCSRILKEIPPGQDEIQFQYLLNFVRAGDVIVVKKLENLSNTFSDLLYHLDELLSNGIDVVSIDDNIDTRTFKNDLYKTLFSTLSRIKKNFYSSSTKQGLISAKKRGVKLGRPKGLSTEAEKRADRVVKLYLKKNLTVNEICEKENIAKATLYRYLKNKNISLHSGSTKK